MFGLVLQPHQVDDVDEPHPQLRQMLAQQVGGGEPAKGSDGSTGG